MAHHAFFAEGSEEKVHADALSYANRVLGLTERNNPDIHQFTFSLFSVQDTKKIFDTVFQSSVSGKKCIIIYASRMFHETQNALLKVFEEPPGGVTIILGIPSSTVLLPTLRSRVQPLPLESKGEKPTNTSIDIQTTEFLSGTPPQREKHIAKLLERTRSDSDEVKQRARSEAAALLKGIAEAAHAHLTSASDPSTSREMQLLLKDLSLFMPITHERSVPLKLIFEHVLLVIPEQLTTP